MTANADPIVRLDRLERDLDALRHELDAVRALVVRAPAARHVEEPTSPLAPVWPALERGDAAQSLTEAFEVLAAWRSSRDPVVLEQLGAFAAELVERTSGRTRSRAEQLALRVAAAKAESGPRVTPVTAPPENVPAPPAPAPREPFTELGPSRADRVADWARAELTGARLFAIAGGTVTLLGIVFLFVLAANRGWVGPQERVALGAVTSLALLLTGLVLRSRYGRVVAAFGAVGAGIAGAYATLAAATVLYGYLPPAAALPIAATIAAVGSLVAVRWSSQILAGLALIGAVLAPGLIALDDGTTPSGTSFAVVVLGAAVAVAAPRRWAWLAACVTVATLVQVAALAAHGPLDDPGAIAVVCGAAFVLLAAAVVWHAHRGPALDAGSSAFAFAAVGTAILGTTALTSDDVHLGLVQLGLAAGFGLVALAVHRRRELAWMILAEALLLVGVAGAFLLSGRSLTVVWAFEATVLAALAWKLRLPRFQAASLAYLIAATVQIAVVELVPSWPDDAFDIPRGAAVGLLALAAAALAAGLLQPSGRSDAPAVGVGTVLEPLWEGLLAARVGLRALLAAAAAVFLTGSLAAVLSEENLTFALVTLAVGVGAAAFLAGERRLQPFALGFYGLAVLHALAVEVPPRTLAYDPAAVGAVVDPLVPVPSLVALAVAAGVLAAMASFEDRGIRALGAPAGLELHADVLRGGAGLVQSALGLAAAVSLVWAAGLVAIDARYEAGQVVATGLWALLGTAIVALGARARSAAWQTVGGVVLVLPLSKAITVDWGLLGDTASSVALLLAASALLASGFACRWLDKTSTAATELVALAIALAFAAMATIALWRLLDGEARPFGVAALAVAVVLAEMGAAPYLRRRAGRAETWLQPLALGYWSLALCVLVLAESAMVGWDVDGTLASWALTAVALALAWRPLEERWVWNLGLIVAVAAATGALLLVTPPSRLLEASAHPGAGLWVLVAAIGACWALALTTPPEARPYAEWLLGAAAAVTLYGISLAVLEVAERVSTASVGTDFQRGHTALSALWGAGALALYVVGLARDRGRLRAVGLALFGLALAKLFLYDLGTLSSITRALSFLVVGAILLAAGFFAERLVRPGGPAQRLG